jgi:hypothetical protein
MLQLQFPRFSSVLLNEKDEKHRVSRFYRFDFYELQSITLMLSLCFQCISSNSPLNAHYNNIEVDTRLGRTPRGNSSRNSAFKQTWFLQQGHGGYSLHLLDQVCFSFPSFADSSTGCYQEQQVIANP